MCGIVAISSRAPSRRVPEAAEVLVLLDAAAAAGSIDEAASLAGECDALLRGEPGVALLAGNLELAAGLVARLDALARRADDEERRIDAVVGDPAAVDAATEALSRLRDAIWAIRNDRIRTARAVFDLAGRGASPAAIGGYLAIQQAFAAIDRLEVRGRDSAGIAVLVWGGGFDPGALRDGIGARGSDPLFVDSSVRVQGSTMVFTYKAAAEIGELGDNTRAMRATVAADEVLRRALSGPEVRCTVIGHTRWASVGIISEPNAHPVTGEESRASAANGGLALAVLNGDVDNHADLRVRHGLSFADPITTDAKVIPALYQRHRVSCEPVEAFRRTVADFDGSVAIALVDADDPATLMLALHGSGQGMCVGLAEDRFVVASEPYGLVEETSAYLRMDGERPADPSRPASRGQIAVLDAHRAGEASAVSLRSYEGEPIETPAAETAEVTTRDIDRGDSPHFLLKEILEAPRSLRRTLRGRIDHAPEGPRVALGEATLPAGIAEALEAGRISRVCVIGQGTAAVAGRSLVALLSWLADSAVDAEAMTATELSGFGLRRDMSDTLVVAVSQSGTTTDTNRTVDLAVARGASVIAVVNRRGSELASKSHGVLYTSDGRDVEMSVASTKAFYAQVAACALLACAIAERTGRARRGAVAELVGALESLPEAMEQVIGLRSAIAESAHRFAPARRYWAVVGNGPNAVAANEVRIKLSELCYKSISCDVTEDKKHIDLSCEPMILVCATGLTDSIASDVAKEIAIYRAHKAVPIVVATEGAGRFDAATSCIWVPRVGAGLDFVLAAMVGHLFGYEAALAIDALARPLREMREVIERAVERGGGGEAALARVSADLARPAESFSGLLQVGQYDGNLEASTAVRVAGLLSLVTSARPLDAYQRATGKVASPEALLDDLVAALTAGVDELTRPIDAIKHQAKTVTVGISRSDENLVDAELVAATFDAGVAREALSYAAMKTLAALSQAVAAVNGFTRYRLEGADSGATEGSPTVTIVERGGIARDLRSRVESNNALVGTKRRVATEQNVLVARGRADGRTVVIVPEIKAGRTTGITLLHVTFTETLPWQVAKSVLQGYDDRYDRLVDWVSETEGSFRDDRLSEVPIADLLVLPVSESAELWRSE